MKCYKRYWKTLLQFVQLFKSTNTESELRPIANILQTLLAIFVYRFYGCTF
jgi:hypothetical protein